MVEWEYKGGFYDQFSAPSKSYLTNIFCWAYRGGNYHERPDPLPAQDLTEMLERVKSYCVECLGYEHQVHNREMFREVLEHLGTDETKEFCRFIAKREKLSADQKQKLKTQNQQQYVNKALQGKPASEKQIAFLKKLGCTVTPDNMHHASTLIEQYKTR